MPSLEVDDDVYQYLLRRAVRIGEDASSILRRELRLSGADDVSLALPGAHEEKHATGPLAKFLRTTQAREGNVTRRYLEILARAAEEHGDGFAIVLTLRGRRRFYFARTKEELSRSGSSLHPQRIPGTQFWAMTNSDNVQKRQILTEVMKLLRYSDPTIEAARSVLH